MREIKFRAWWERFGEMIDVDVLAINAVTWDSSGTGVSLAYQPHVKVMQYTGVKDKNGIDIYEGDIVEVIDEELTHVVEWCGEDEFGYPIGWGLFPKTFTYKVIGNIYENKNLLEELK